MSTWSLKLIKARTRDMGGFNVRRVLPDTDQPMVGPFVFFDHMGPVDFEPGQGVDVRPHPHINLATVTYLFAGELKHCDSLGTSQIIRPGDVNWMTAGSGIVHSERTPDTVRNVSHELHGIQSWVALPVDQEEMAPEFTHYQGEHLPVVTRDGALIKLIAGKAFGAESPVATFGELFYADVRLVAGHDLRMPDSYEERAFYLVEGTGVVRGVKFREGSLIVIEPDDPCEIHALTDCHMMLLGGAPFQYRYIWWNFVSSREKRIQQAKDDWANDRFPPVPGETDRIPLPA